MSGLPHELTVMLVAATPVVELRGSIPLAIAAFHMPVPAAVGWSLVGNMIPVFLIYAAGDAWTSFCDRRRGWWERLTRAVLERARRKLNGKYVRYGLWALALFVAIPLPATGAVTGTLAAYVFGVPLKRAWPYILLGLAIAAAVVTLATTGLIAGAGVLTK